MAFYSLHNENGALSYGSGPSLPDGATEMTEQGVSDAVEAARARTLADAAAAAVTAAQARIALSREGKLDAVKAAVAAAGGEVEIWFDYATAWERQNQHVIDLGTGLGLSSDQIDALFTRAAAISAGGVSSTS